MMIDEQLIQLLLRAAYQARMQQKRVDVCMEDLAVAQETMRDYKQQLNALKATMRAQENGCQHEWRIAKERLWWYCDICQSIRFEDEKRD